MCDLLLLIVNKIIIINTLDTHPSAPPRNNHAWKHSNSYLRDRNAKHLQGPPLSRTKRVRERRKIVTVLGKKVPIALNGIRTCTSGIRAHRAADYTPKVCVCVCVCVCVRALADMRVST